MLIRLTTLAAAGLLAVSTAALTPAPDVDWAMVAKIREEGLQRSRVMDFESYMTDVLGARLTLSRDMQRAQKWLLGELTTMGLTNVAAEPFMDFGVAWDNEYVSLQMLEPDYSPMVAYPIAHTAGTNGRKVADAVIVELATKDDLAKYKGTLKGKAVLSTPPPVIDLAPLTKGVPRLTEQDLDSLERTVIAPTRPTPPRPAPNPNALTAVDRCGSSRTRAWPSCCRARAVGWVPCAGTRAPTRRPTSGRGPATSPPPRSSPSPPSTTIGCTASSSATSR
jgi:hypothetical protein